MQKEELYHRIVTGFDKHSRNGIEYYTSPLIEKTGLVRHAFTARKGGVSPAPFDSLNFSKKRETNHENIYQNYKIVAESFDLDMDSFVVDNYAHSYNVVYADRSVAGLKEENPLPLCDGITTDKKDVTLITLHADCLPLYFVDVKHRAVSICHAGWKGVYTHIVLKTADKMRETYGTEPEDIVAAIGPAIGPCCFEVQEDVARLFRQEFGDGTVRQHEGRLYCDLWRACALDMLAAGILPEHINCAKACTSCDPEHFYSHRRDKGKTGAMLSFIKIL